MKNKTGPMMGKWTVLCSRRQYNFDRPIGWQTFDFGVFKVHTRPAEGEAYTRKHYRGFWLTISVYVPISISFR